MKKQQIKAGFASVLAGVIAPVALLVPSVSAATVNWSGANEESNNSTSAVGNWFDAVPANGDTAVFGSAGNYQIVDNDLSGLSLEKVIFSGAVSATSSKDYEITGNGITVMDAIEAAMTGVGGNQMVGLDVTLGDDVTFMTTGVNTLQVGNTEGEVSTLLDMGTNNLTVQADGGTITIAGEVDGSGTVIKRGSGKLNMLATPAETFTGSVNVAEGDLVTTATTQGNIAVTGGRLMGVSELLGDVSMSSGEINPGLSPGCIAVDNLNLTGGTYTVEIEGTEICTEYDSVTVLEGVDLGTATELNVVWGGGFEPEVDDSFAIIVNDGGEAVEGMFAGLEDGDTFTVDGVTLQINYDAGEGSNDVFLLVVEGPESPDTGIGSLLASPFVAIMAMVVAAATIGGAKYVEARRK